MTGFVTRFAPSPTGHLHLGHAASAFAVWETAARSGGEVRLRLEDIDQTRCRRVYEASILADLRWLGLDWQGPVRRQSDHIGDYLAVLEALAGRGLVYRCFRTRREISASLPAGANPDEGGYRGRPLPPAEEAERLAKGQSFAWRLSLGAARDALGPHYVRMSYPLARAAGDVRRVSVSPDRFGDVVLGRKDTPASYHLACCHDDALQGITHVVRGDDVRDVTDVHVLLQSLMGWPQPVYQFHPLVRDTDGRKLAKRHGDKGLRAWRDEGKTPSDLRAMIELA